MKISQEVGRGGVLGNIVWGNRGKERRGKGGKGGRVKYCKCREGI